jgi:uncharacterized protein (TIGR03118 family)
MTDNFLLRQLSIDNVFQKFTKSMNNKVLTTIRPNAGKVCVLLLVVFVFATGCQKQKINEKILRDFSQVNLVDDNGEFGAVHKDTSLRNAWGLAWAPSGIAWVNSQAGHVSELYTGEGATVRPGVKIPAPGDTIGGSPTGVVFASGMGFKLPNNSGALFLFVGDDGILSGWNGGNNAKTIQDHSATSSYTGLTINKWGTRPLLYAANFKTGKINVWDTLWTSVSLPFHDPQLPSGYSPFNIQSIGNWLYVMYAKVGKDGNEVHAVGLGIVDIFNPDGTLVRRFASHGTLDAPWGVAMVPASFLEDSDMDQDDSETGKGEDNANKVPVSIKDQPAILVGNFGDGHINVYSQDGIFVGQLQKHNHPIVIDGLWALMLPPSTSTIDQHRLYFTAGPSDETKGLFGYLIKE